MIGGKGDGDLRSSSSRGLVPHLCASGTLRGTGKNKNRAGLIIPRGAIIST